MKAVSLAAVVLLGSCGAGLPGSGTHTCSLVGCVDQFTATLHDANGALPSGQMMLTVTADGETAACSFTLPLATLPGGGTAGIDCPSGLQVQVILASTCMTSQNGQSVSQTCTPIPGKMSEQITIMGKPKTVKITQTVDGVTYVADIVTPTYETSQPNGPGCDPICAQAGSELVLAPQ